MPDNRLIFVIIDPTSDTQPALKRAAVIAKRDGSAIHAYLCIYSRTETDDPERLKRVEIARHEAWLETFMEPLRQEGVEIAHRIEWAPDWREAISAAANNEDYHLVIKPSRRRNTRQRIMMTSSDMALFESVRSPVLLMLPDAEVKEHLERILVAVDVKRDNQKYRKILERKLQLANSIQSMNKAELHAVYCYEEPDDYVHVTEIARATGLDSSHVHAVGANPEEGIVRVAREIDADFVIIGLSTRSVLSNRFFGSTSDWLLNNLDHDILVMVN